MKHTIASQHYENCKKVERFYASALAVYTDSVSPSSVDHRCAVGKFAPRRWVGKSQRIAEVWRPPLPDREASLIKKEYCRCLPHPLQVISSGARPHLLRERATLAAPPDPRGWSLRLMTSIALRGPTNLYRRPPPVPHCTPRLSHLSVGGNTRGLEMAWPTRHVGAGLRGLLGPTAHGLLGRRHPGPRLSHMAGWGWGLKYRDSQIFVRGAWHVLSYLGAWSLGLFSPTFFSTSSKKKPSTGHQA